MDGGKAPVSGPPPSSRAAMSPASVSAAKGVTYGTGPPPASRRRAPAPRAARPSARPASGAPGSGRRAVARCRRRPGRGRRRRDGRSSGRGRRGLKAFLGPERVAYAEGLDVHGCGGGPRPAVPSQSCRQQLREQVGGVRQDVRPGLNGHRGRPRRPPSAAPGPWRWSPTAGPRGRPHIQGVAPGGPQPLQHRVERRLRPVHRHGLPAHRDRRRGQVPSSGSPRSTTAPGSSAASWTWPSRSRRAEAAAVRRESPAPTAQRPCREGPFASSVAPFAPWVGPFTSRARTT